MKAYIISPLDNVNYEFIHILKNNNILISCYCTFFEISACPVMSQEEATKIGINNARNKLKKDGKHSIMREIKQKIKILLEMGCAKTYVEVQKMNGISIYTSNSDDLKNRLIGCSSFMHVAIYGKRLSDILPIYKIKSKQIFDFNLKYHK